jgi:hypothetical protein
MSTKFVARLHSRAQLTHDTALFTFVGDFEVPKVPTWHFIIQ